MKTIKEFNTIDDFVDFIKDHPEIKSIKEFTKKFGSIYSRYLFLLHNKLITEPFPIDSKRKNYSDNTKYNSVDDFQKYIDSNNIGSNVEFRKLNLPLYSRATRLKNILNRLVYPGKVNHHLINTLPKIQKFIFENYISSKKELKRKHISIYRNYLKLRNKETDIIEFCKPLLESDHEKLFFESLIKNGVNINDIIIQFSPTWSYKRRYDFLIKSKKTIIEVHGRHHFNPDLLKDVWDCKDTLEIDKYKYDLAINNGYKIIYFTFNEKEYLEYGYFYKVYTNIKELLCHVFKDEELSVKSDSDCSIEISSLFDKQYYLKKAEDIIIENEEKDEIIECIRSLWSLEDVNCFLQKHKVVSPKDLKQRFPQVFNKSEKFGWINKLYYYFESDEVGNIKNYRCLDDVNNLIQRFKITNLNTFRTNYNNIYNKCFREGWLKDVQYYKEE